MNAELITSNIDLVKIVARSVRCRLPKYISLDDLCAAGEDGLMQASERFDENEGTPFRGYAQSRIRGAMYDWLRTHYGKRAKAFRKGISLLPWDTLEGHDSPMAFKSGDWYKGDLYFKYEPLKKVSETDERAFLKSLCGSRDLERLLELYYFRDFSMQEISKELGFCESRISQLHSVLIQRFRSMYSSGKFKLVK